MIPISVLFFRLVCQSKRQYLTDNYHSKKKKKKPRSYYTVHSVRSRKSDETQCYLDRRINDVR